MTSLAQKFEKYADDYRGQFSHEPDADGRARSYEIAAQRVRYVLTEEEARVLRSLIEQIEGARRVGEKIWIDGGELSVIKKAVAALTDPEPQKLWRKTYAATTPPRSSPEAAEEDTFSASSVLEVSTDGGKTWERVES